MWFISQRWWSWLRMRGWCRCQWGVRVVGVHSASVFPVPVSVMVLSNVLMDLTRGTVARYYNSSHLFWYIFIQLCGPEWIFFVYSMCLINRPTFSYSTVIWFTSTDLLNVASFGDMTLLHCVTQHVKWPYSVMYVPCLIFQVRTCELLLASTTLSCSCLLAIIIFRQANQNTK